MPWGTMRIYSASFPMRVLIADDHALIRAGLRLSLRLNFDEVEYLEAADGAEAVLVAERAQPGVTILDVGMPKPSGPEAVIDVARTSAALSRTTATAPMPTVRTSFLPRLCSLAGENRRDGVRTHTAIP